MRIIWRTIPHELVSQGTVVGLFICHFLFHVTVVHFSLDHLFKCQFHLETRLFYSVNEFPALSLECIVEGCAAKGLTLAKGLLC